MGVSSTNGGGTVPKRKLIEVALPLEAINRESAREKSIRHGHPATLHLWWARRPLAAARAVLFAQLVDDPSSNPDRFPTEEAQRAERERLHRIIERLVVWENTRDQALLDAAHHEIVKSTDGNPPAILDPFAGGGTIPLEAQRLGLEADASDLNPVAVLINKALIEIPPRFAGRPPVFPGLATSKMDWPGATGLAADVRAYGQWMRDEAEKKIGYLYPKADGKPVIAWIWARTVTCPNPACGIEMPLVRSWWLGKKKGKEAYVVPQVVPDETALGGRRVRFEIGHTAVAAPRPDIDGTVARTAATCVACKGSVPLRYVREEGKSGRIGAVLMAVVAEGNRRREYLPPIEEHRQAADVDLPDSVPVGSLPPHGLQPANPQTIRIYGVNEWSDLFTTRQLVALTTLSDLVIAAHSKTIADGGTKEYADAVATYLGLAQSKMTNLSSSITTWMSDRGAFRETFARQAIPMTWDYAESNVLSDAGGGWSTVLDKVAQVVDALPSGVGTVRQANAAEVDFAHRIVNTDPPYYDNIGYSDLSDFFYVWLRRSLRSVYPDLFSTMLVPKAEELVANPHRHDGKGGAKAFFETGFRQVFKHARESALATFPITVYYAFKQSDSGDDGIASTGWETLLDGMIRTGWAITATWPMRTEGAGRLLAKDTNALASSIVLALRPRPENAPTIDRRGLIEALHDELPDALRKLQQGAIAPVDLPQAAIGPGMAVFSRYAKVIENDGSPMAVRSALARINEILDQVLNEQEGDFDNATRFAIAWYRQHGYAKGGFGAADNIARARNTSVETMVHAGILTSAAGKVELFAPGELPEDYNVLNDDRIGVWEALHHLIAQLDRGGLPQAGDFVAAVEARPDGAVDVELVKELAFLLFAIAEKNGWTQDALAFNTVATAWPDILDAARSGMAAATGTQTSFDLEEG
jgi:putative DNA methylase